MAAATESQFLAGPAREFSNNNPYYHHASPSPSRYNLSLTRSNSVPSIFFPESREHQPVEPKRKQRDSTGTRGHRHHRSARHSRPKNTDVIDQLDDASAFQYHHEGPYDAALPRRNQDSKKSPIEALKDSHAEILKATPHDKLVDCLESHRPLDGVAFFPPGHTDRDGNTYDYEEGSNMMNDYGNFFRVPGLKFTEEDFKNDPFYNSPPPKPFTALKKALSIRRRKRSDTS
ncbi:hypothetical protein ASPZODRAFT_142719 [Penicilliopsis zonata CBS 506.65]|uniref:Pal1 cell morphology protein n=1 Tax=Penicilliopsis zonata CBS 506.65 TaxID=1073090 RepID=A0A1L9SFS2_9EURO|nr:hypothetical protein ASPZODRAFT_142719 [Penicilliopsis zonata CBS 506.65]OJJ46090.1 hypothetical protein ASPZODRAFT_142719 [Penicilliopsis zonata CBS 506.65]